MSTLKVSSLAGRVSGNAPTLTDGAVLPVGVALTGGGGINVTGVITATSFSGSGANLTGIDASALKSSGAVKVQANSTGAVVTGNFGIGDDTPDTKLSVNSGTTDVAAKFTSTDANAWVQFRDNSTTDTGVMVGANGDNLLLRAGSNERLRIGTAGQIGLGGANYGSDGQILTSKGSGAAVQWATPSSGLGLADEWAHSGANFTSGNDVYYDGTNYSKLNSATSSVMTVTGGGSEGVFSFPSTGMYRIYYAAYVNLNGGGYYRLRGFGSRNNASSWTENVIYSQNLQDTNSGNSYPDYTNHEAFFNVTNTTNDKLKFGVIVPTQDGSAGNVRINFMKLN